MAPSQGPRTVRPAPRRPAEPLVVKTSDLAAVLSIWMERHESQHPSGPKLTRGQAVRHYSAVRFICDRAGITDHALHGILEGRRLTTQFSIADDCLSAIGEEGRLCIDVGVYANPEWPRRRVLRELEKRGVDVEDVFWLWEDGVQDYDVSMPTPRPEAGLLYIRVAAAIAESQQLCETTRGKG